MLKTLAQHLISDEIHHPIITRVYRTILILTILSIVIIAILDTKAQIHTEYADIFHRVYFLFYFMLFIDFSLRLVGAFYGLNIKNSNELDHNSYSSTKDYLLSFYGLVDFISSVLFFFLLFDIRLQDAKTVLSLFTLLKLARYSPALVILKDVFVSERKTLFASLYVMMILTISTSAILYFVERDVNKDGFSSLLDSIWWSVITLSTVGYGDIIPQTALGKFLGGLAAISGFGMFALPAGILANGFANEIKRLKEMASWSMVAKVPFFSSLDSAAIFDIASLLRVRRFRKNEIIIKEGSVGESMYFILEGRVKVVSKHLNVVLKKGDFFGEIALLKNIPRVATVIANERCELLELSRYDFQNLISSRPNLLEDIQNVAAKRYKD